MATEEVKYETRTVRAIRGMEARTASKWEKEGWEVVSQSQGKLQSEITIRRPQPKSHWRLYAIGGAVFAVALIAIIVNGVISEQRNTDTADEPAPAVSESAAEKGETVERTPAEEPEPTPSEEEAAAVITTESDPEFAALLTLGNNCDASVAAFIEQHSGQQVAFDGHVASMANHEGYDTRYDILIGAGDYSETSSSGPSFQFQDVNATNDLHWTGDNPGTIGVGDNLRITAEIVGEIYPEPGNWNCLFYLEPVITAVR